MKRSEFKEMVDGLLHVHHIKGVGNNIKTTIVDTGRGAGNELELWVLKAKQECSYGDEYIINDNYCVVKTVKIHTYGKWLKTPQEVAEIINSL